MINFTLSINDCNQIIKRALLKKNDSLFYFFFHIMENDLETAYACAKKCQSHKKQLVKMASDILAAYDCGTLHTLIKVSPKS